ncbi:MAG: hypothetical protein U1F42_01110 [Candidatus Competibacteraceae bacterium]
MLEDICRHLVAWRAAGLRGVAMAVVSLARRATTALGGTFGRVAGAL